MYHFRILHSVLELLQCIVIISDIDLQLCLGVVHNRILIYINL